MKSKIKIILVDDHQIVRDGIRVLISAYPDIEICGEASNASELFVLLETKQPDIILLDISLPDMSGIEVTKKLVEQYPSIKILILSMYVQQDFITNAIAAGVSGYLPKNTTKKELKEAINQISEGNKYFNSDINKIIIDSYINTINKPETPKEPTITEQLTTREIEILKLVAEGLNNKEISDKLFISIRTVESHKNHIMQKLDVKNSVGLLKYAIKHNIVNDI